MPPSPKEPEFAQRTLQARSLASRDLLPECKEEVVEVIHGDRTRVRFASGRECTVPSHVRFQVIRDGRRAARAWLLNALTKKEISESAIPTLPWYLADAFEELARSGLASSKARLGRVA